jgi:ABC-2 type transport system permease protein
MMKIFHIAFKDVKQSFRSFLAVAMMFVVPILITGLFALLFGGTGDDDSANFELPVTPVWVVNQDEGELGQIMVDLWQSEGLSDLLDVTEVSDFDEARSAVENQEAAAAVIIPVDLTASLYGSGGQSEIEIYQDPTLTLGPGIVTTLVSQFTDGFSGATIAVGVVNQQMAEAGLMLSLEQSMQIVGQYQAAFENYNTGVGALTVETPSGETQSNGEVGSMLAMVMGGMLIFYAYFTGSLSSNSLLTEEHNQTLARMLSTATSPVQVIGGKLLAGGMMVFVQISVLLTFGRLVFGIHWGELWLLVLFTAVATIGAITFGLFAISWAKDRKQAGLIMGAGLTITGMLGMASIFMMGAANPSQAINSLSLLVPQGWANRALVNIMDGFAVSEALTSMLGLLVYSVVMFVIGMRRFMKRFA